MSDETRFPAWIRERRSQLGVVLRGPLRGANVVVEPASADAWQILVKGQERSQRYDIWVDNDADLLDWMNSADFGFEVLREAD